MKVYKVTSASNLLEVLEPEGEGLAVAGRCSSNSHPPLDLHLCDQKQPSAIGAQTLSVWGVGFSLSATLRTVCVQGAADAQLGGGGRGLCVLRPETPQIIRSDQPRPPREAAGLQQTSGLRNSSSRQTLPLGWWPAGATPAAPRSVASPHPPRLDALVCHLFLPAAQCVQPADLNVVGA